jgi:hypothetical protein
MSAITTSIKSGYVAVVFHDTKSGLGLRWRDADSVANALIAIARNLPHDETVRVKNLKISQIETGAVLSDVMNGRTLVVIPQDSLLNTAFAIKAQARKLEEVENVERVIFDHALLQRKGINLGLTSDPGIQDEAAKEAMWNSTLRKAIDSGSFRQYHVGTPNVNKDLKSATEGIIHAP